MAENYKFFNSGIGDARKYKASDFADYFGSILSTGLLHTDDVPGMVVSVETGTLNTIVSTGKVIMKGHLYENTTPLTLTHGIPEPSMDRIDRVVLRLNLQNAERNIKLHVIQGVPGAIPTAPALQRDNFIHEISLAQILVRANTAQLVQADLVDERLDEELCGLAYSLISIPTAQFQAEWDAFMEGIEDSGFASAEALETHMADGAAHGIGNKATLLTTNKTNLVSAINEAFQSASDGKTAVANAVTAKGVTASPADTFPTLASKIGQIATGIKSAEGTGTSGGSSASIVSNLSFRPNLVLISHTNIDTSMCITTLSDPPELFGSITDPSIFINSVTTYKNYSNSSGYTINAGGSISDTGFTLTIQHTNYKWWAFEI